MLSHENGKQDVKSCKTLQNHVSEYEVMCIECVLRLLLGKEATVLDWVPKFHTPCVQRKRSSVMPQLLL